MRLLIACLILGLGPAPMKGCKDSEWSRVYDPDSLEPCTSSEYEDHDAVGDDHEKYTPYEIETSAACGCNVAGMYKYLKISDGKWETAALVDFGYGECDGWAVKTLCAHGDCEHPEASMCRFALACGPNAE